MADIAILEHEVGALKNDVKDIREQLEDLDDSCTSHSDRILNVEYWKNGNGARGAEARLQEVEHAMVVLKECFGASNTDEMVNKIATSAAKAVITNARTRDKTFVEKLKAVAAILSPICAAAAVVIAAIVAAS